MSRTLRYGSTNGTPFHRSTMTLLEVPMPMATRPGAASASDATHWAKHAGRARERGHDRRAEAQPRLPHRRQRERGEGVVRRRPRPTTHRCSRGRRVRRTPSAWLCNGPGRGTVMPGRMGIVITSSSGRSGRSRFGRGVGPVAGDAALAGGREQRAVGGEHVDHAVAEAALDGLQVDVEEHPRGGHRAHDAQGVVEAVAAAADAERLADADRHVVAEHGERGGVDAGRDLGDARPHLRPAVAGRAVELVQVATASRSAAPSDRRRSR